MIRNTLSKARSSLRTLLAFLTPILVSTLPVSGTTGAVAIENYGEGLYFSTEGAIDGLYLRVRGPAGFRHSENTPDVGLLFEPGPGAPDGLYHFELVTRPAMSPAALAALEQARSTGDRREVERLRALGEWVETEPVRGTFRLEYGSIVALVDDVEEEAAEERFYETAEDPATEPGDWQEPATKDQVVADDLIVAGSACIGDDCTSGIGFGEDTLRLKEFNTRIHFEDISGGTYPSNDWRLKANSTSNGGANFFGLVDVDSGQTPFRVDAGAQGNALRVDDSGRVGLGTSNPARTLHVSDDDSPTLRLDQTAASGFAPQVWDLRGNEASFSVVDVTTGQTPFRVDAGAQGNALYVDGTGNVGFGTSNPGTTLHVADSSPTIRFDQTLGTPQAWDLNSNQGVFSVANANTGAAPFSVRPGATTDMLVLAGGGVGVGTTNPSVDLHVADGNSPILRLEHTTSGRLWDLGGTSGDFFVRDTANGGTVPFRVWADAEEGTLEVLPNGRVYIGDPVGVTLLTEGKLGLGTEAPRAPIHVARDGGVLGDQVTEELAIFENDAGMHVSFVRTGTVVDWQVGVKDHNNFFIQVPFATPLPQLQLNPSGLLSISGDLLYGADQELLTQVIGALEARIAALEAEVASHHP